jgi:hypothetical protein
LVDFYEGRRYNTPFIVYKWMDMWPVFDLIATYGHLIHNLVIVYIAINLNVSFMMLIYLSTVCIFYMTSIYKVQKRARKLNQEFNIMSQCDLTYANMATKEYMTLASAEFLNVRSKMWKFQFGLLVVGACIGFPTTLLYKAKVEID